jgi:hypothetical protein
MNVSVEAVSSIIRVLLRSVLLLVVTANDVSSSLSVLALIMEAKRSYETATLKEPHGDTSHKTIFLIVLAVKTSNLT